MQLQHALYEDTGQAVTSIKLIIDFWVWFPINFIFLIPWEAKIRAPYGASKITIKSYFLIFRH